MAIEDENKRDREIWTDVSRHWYSRASDKAPTTGRLHHHLAILARQNVVAQLFYYTKSLCVPIPFGNSRDSILTLFDPIMAGTQGGDLKPVDRALVKCHGIFYTGKNTENLDDTRNEFLSNLDLTIAKASRDWLATGYQIAITNICALLDYGLATNGIMRAIAASTEPPPMPEAADDASNSQSELETDTKEAKGSDVVDLLKDFKERLQFVESTDTIVLSRLGDLNILSYLNVRLMFLHQMAILKGPGGAEPKIPATSHFEDSFPWHLLAMCLNSFAAGFDDSTKYENEQFPNSPARPGPKMGADNIKITGAENISRPAGKIMPETGSNDHK